MNIKKMNSGLKMVTSMFITQHSGNIPASPWGEWRCDIPVRMAEVGLLSVVLVISILLPFIRNWDLIYDIRPW